jgi:uncharacterized protein with GYD domain
LYIVLGKFSQEGVAKIKESPQRLEAAKKVLRSVGGEIKEFYYTMGRYDFVAMCEAPNDEAIMKALFIIGAVGAVRTETLATIPAEKAAGIIKTLP